MSPNLPSIFAGCGVMPQHRLAPLRGLRTAAAGPPVPVATALANGRRRNGRRQNGTA